MSQSAMKRNWVEFIFFMIGVALFFASCGKPVQVTIGNKKRVKSHERPTTRTKERTYVKYTKKTTRPTTTSRAVPKVDRLDVRNEIVSTAKKFLGKPYNYGGKTPRSGFDCSGFTAYVYNAHGIDVHGPSYEQARLGKKKKLDEVKEGDLLIFGKGSKVSHVAIVAARDSQSLQVVHSTSSRGVVVDDIAHSDYWKKRFLYAKDVISL